MTKFVSPGEGGETPWDETRFAPGRNLFRPWETTPAAGGGAAGAVFVVNPREEVKADRIRQGRGGGRPWRNSLTSDRLAGDDLDLVADDAEIMELAVRKATQLGNRLAINAPVTIVADQVHCRSLFKTGSDHLRSEGLDRLASDEVDVAAADAEVGQFTVAQAAQLGNSVPVAAPVAIVADQVHGISRFVFLSDHSVFQYAMKIGRVISV